MPRDDLFSRHGITWQRHWIGDNSGHYEWKSECGRFLAWGERAVYLAAVDGEIVADHARSLLEAMNEAARAGRA
jgi:hypothetical protein